MRSSKQWLVLAVDDEAPLLRVIKRALETHGFSVLTAADGDEALEVATAHPEPIDLLVTDMVMPGLTGPELHKALKQKLPELPAIFISGTAPSGLEPGSVFLAKPFSPGQLVAMAKALLGP